MRASILLVLLVLAGCRSTTRDARAVLHSLADAVNRLDEVALWQHVSSERREFESHANRTGRVSWGQFRQEIAQAQAALDQPIRTATTPTRLVVMGWLKADGVALQKLSAPTFIIDRDGRLTYHNNTTSNAFWTTDHAQAETAVHALSESDFTNWFVIGDPQRVPLSTRQAFVAAGFDMTPDNREQAKVIAKVNERVPGPPKTAP